jgi:hypothetical protein
MRKAAANISEQNEKTERRNRPGYSPSRPNGGAKRREKMKTSLRLAAANDGVPTVQGELERLGRKIGIAISGGDRADEGMYKANAHSKDAENFYALAANQLAEWLSVTEDAIPTIRAVTLGDAIVALIRASALADEISDISLSDEKPDVYALKRLHRHLRVCLYSVLHPVRDAAPGVYEACGGDYYMPMKYDHFRAIDIADGLFEKADSELAKSRVA